MRLSRQKFHSLFSAIHLSFPNRVFHDSIARVFFHHPIFKSEYPHNYCLYQAIFFIFTKQSTIRDICCKFAKWHRISCHGTGFCVDSIYNIPNWNATNKKRVFHFFISTKFNLRAVMFQSHVQLLILAICFSAQFYHSTLIDDLMIIFQSNLVIYGNKLIMESFTEQTSPVNFNVSNTNGKTEAKNTFSANYHNNFDYLLSYEFHICVNNCFSTHEQVIFVNKRFIRRSGMFLWLRVNKFTFHVNWFVQLDESLGLTQRANKTTNGILVYELYWWNKWKLICQWDMVSAHTSSWIRSTRYLKRIPSAKSFFQE